MIRFYTIHHCRYCPQSLAIKYTRKDTAFRTELSQGLSAISCVYYKTYTSFKGAKVQIYFYNKKLFLSFSPRAIENMGEFEMWANLEWGRIEGKHTQQHRANCNMGELQFAPTTHANALIPSP